MKANITNHSDCKQHWRVFQYETMSSFAKKHNARLTVMENGEHWFHTEVQMKFLDEWVLNQNCQ